MGSFHGCLLLLEKKRQFHLEGTTTILVFIQLQIMKALQSSTKQKKLQFQCCIPNKILFRIWNTFLPFSSSVDIFSFLWLHRLFFPLMCLPFLSSYLTRNNSMKINNLHVIMTVDLSSLEININTYVVFISYIYLFIISALPNTKFYGTKNPEI